jgi:D-3-phosphoglycerate dehydrogenase
LGNGESKPVFDSLRSSSSHRVASPRFYMSKIGVGEMSRNELGKVFDIVATGPIDPVAVDILAPYGNLVVAADGSEESLLPLMGQAVGLVVRGGGVATKSMISAAPHLRVIGRPGAGYDSVDVGAATERKIPLVYVPGVGARAVAEAAITLMLALAKDLPYWDRQVRAGNWRSRFQSSPKDISGSVIGLVGLGNIGSMLAKLLGAFNARLQAYDPLIAQEKAKVYEVELVSLDYLLRTSDFVSLHAPLTAETRGMINRATLGIMKPGSFLINLARGGLIESIDVLYEFLKSGKLAGAALDVFEPEPPDHTHAIFQLKNLITSPHALAMTDGTMRQIFKTMAEDMAAVFDGRNPRLIVNPEVLRKGSSTAKK